MEIIKERVRASQIIGHENLVELVEGDIIVPDIKPDILSLTKTDGIAFITNKEVQDGKVKLQGMIDIYSIYIADDETNSLRGLSATLNFNETIEMKDCEDGMIPIIKYNLNNIECKVLNGRKITVKCPVEIDLKVIKDSEFEISRDVKDCDDIQILKESMKLNSLIGHNRENISINENVSLPENSESIGEILKCSIDLINKDYKISYNKVLAKAEARVKIIYTAENDANSIETFETIIPFTGFVDINGINENTAFDFCYTLKNYCIKPIYQDMKATGINIEADIEVLAIAHEMKDVVVMQDLYSPDVVLNYNLKSVELNQNLNRQENRVKMDELLSIPELDNAKLLDINARANLTDRKLMDDKIIVDGNIMLDILYCKRDRRTMESKKVEIPFEYSISRDKNVTDTNEVSVEILDLEYELDSSGRLKVKMNLEFNNNTIDRISLNVIDNLEQTSEKLESTASLIIYPVKQGDTLWQIAKRFRTTIENIKVVNELTSDEIIPMQQLVIPKRVYKVALDPLN